MFRSARLLTPLLFVLAIAGGGAAAANEAHAERIHHFLEVSGGLDRASGVMSGLANRFIEALSESNPNLPPRTFEILREEFTATWEISRESYLAMLTPVYVRLYTAEDIEQLIAFHESPVGVKQRSLSAQLTVDAARASQEWSRKLGSLAAQRALKRMREEGIVLQGG